MSKQRFEFWYNTEEAWKASFVADSLEEAEQLLEQLENGDIDITDLEGYWEKNKGIEFAVDTNSLEYVRDEA